MIVFRPLSDRFYTFLLLVFRGRYPKIFLEYRTEILRIVKTCQGCSLCDGAMVAQENGGAFQAYDTDEVLRRLTRIGF
jgi:hypothetical protein